MSTEVPISVQWDVHTRSALIQDDIRDKLNDAIADNGSNVTFQFMSDSSEICSRTYIVKKVCSRENRVSSFALCEKSLLLRIIPDIFIPARYRIALNRILPIGINDPEIKTCCFKAENEFSTHGCKMTMPDNDYQAQRSGFQPEQLLVSSTAKISVIKSEEEQLTKDVCIATFDYQHTSQMPKVEVNTITKMKMVNKLIKTRKPLIAVDVDHVLVKLSVAAKNDIAEAATEAEIKEIFEGLKRNYPEAQFIAISKGGNTIDKLKVIDMDNFFAKIIDSQNVEYSHHMGKGNKINHYLEETGFEATEIVMIDDQLPNHHEVYHACSHRYRCTNIQYLGALTNLGECKAAKAEAEISAKEGPTKDYLKDIHYLGQSAQEQYFDCKLVELMESSAVKMKLRDELSLAEQKFFQDLLLVEEIETL